MLATISRSRTNTRRSRWAPEPVRVLPPGRPASGPDPGLAFFDWVVVLMGVLLPARRTPHVGGIPSQVLAPVKGDHLPRHGRGSEDEADGAGDLLGRRAAAQDGGLALALELL